MAAVKYKLRNIFCLFQVFCLFVSIIVEQWGRKSDYIKCELIGGESTRHLNIISNPFIIY